MTDFDLIKGVLEGKRLLGFMPLKKDEYEKGDWDNAIAIYLGYPESTECWVLRTENQDYSMYDYWIIEKSKTIIERDDRYKAIGELINSVEQIEIKSEDWSNEEDQIQFIIKTNTKHLRFGHHWNDCHYPNSIWDEI